MKPKHVLLTWLITLVLGLMVATIATADFATGLIFTLVAGICSIPYVAIMIAVVTVVKTFWKLQLIHLLITVVTGLLIKGAGERFFSEVYWAVLPYFLLGLLAQAYWWFIVQPNYETAKEIETISQV